MGLWYLQAVLNDNSTDLECYNSFESELNGNFVMIENRKDLTGKMYVDHFSSLIKDTINENLFHISADQLAYKQVLT